MENLLFLGVPILKHITVVNSLDSGTIINLESGITSGIFL